MQEINIRGMRAAIEQLNTLVNEAGRIVRFPSKVRAPEKPF